MVVPPLMQTPVCAERLPAIPPEQVDDDVQSAATDDVSAEGKSGKSAAQ